MVLGALLWASTALAQSIASGKVAGPDNQPIFAAGIRQRVCEVVTEADEGGSFSLINPAGNNSILLVGRLDYPTKTIKLAAGQTTPDVQLAEGFNSL